MYAPIRMRTPDCIQWGISGGTVDILFVCVHVCVIFASDLLGGLPDSSIRYYKVRSKLTFHYFARFLVKISSHPDGCCKWKAVSIDRFSVLF